jgi:hypothetical protein
MRRRFKCTCHVLGTHIIHCRPHVYNMRNAIVTNCALRCYDSPHLGHTPLGTQSRYVTLHSVLTRHVSAPSCRDVADTLTQTHHDLHKVHATG